MSTIPDNDAWIGRFKALQKFYDERGRLPRNHPKGGREDTLRNWLERQRLMWEAGLLPTNLERILRMVPKALPTRRSAGQTTPLRIQEFFAEHGRLPRDRGPIQGERFLYKYLRELARPRYKAGTLDRAVTARLATVPGALEARKWTRRSPAEEPELADVA